MTQRQVRPKDWLHHLWHIDKSLDFIKDGGSLIRFAIVDDDATHDALVEQLELVPCENGAWLFSAADTPERRIYQPDSVVANIAEAIEITEILNALIRNVWKSIGVSDPETISASKAAALIGVDVDVAYKLFFNKVKQFMGRLETNDDSNTPSSGCVYTRDFQNATINSCLEIVDGRTESASIFENWLRDTPSPVSERKNMGIMSPLKRENATGVLRSLISLCGMSDSSICILHLDIRRVTDAKLYDEYAQFPNVTKGSRLATYQWLRELVDTTSFFSNTLILVEVGPTFPDISPGGKGIGTYDALKNRIIDDVSVDGRPNLSAVLVPLAN